MLVQSWYKVTLVFNNIDASKHLSMIYFNADVKANIYEAIFIVHNVKLLYNNIRFTKSCFFFKFRNHNQEKQNMRKLEKKIDYSKMMQWIEV